MKRTFLEISAQNFGDKKEKELSVAVRLGARSNSKNRGISKAFSALQRALKQSRSSSSNGTSSRRSTFSRGAGQGTVKAPSLQRVAVRFAFSNARTKGQWGAHGKYLERESAQGVELEPGEKRVPTPGFGSEGDDMAISKTLDEWQKAGDRNLFKMIVSPEFGDKMDLKKAIEEQVRAMQRDLGTNLEWVAVIHQNTDNPHAHVAIRGRDDKGQHLTINRGYIKEGARTRAMEAATRQLGYRTGLDIAEADQRQIVQQRFTDIDRRIVKKLDPASIIRFSNPPPHSEAIQQERLLQIRRLSQLETMGLATRIAPMQWQVSENLEHTLRQVQIGQDRLKTKFAHREMVSDPNAQLIAVDLAQMGNLAGKLIGTGLNDDTQKPYMLVESVDGQLLYMPQPRVVEQMRQKGQLLTGQYLTMTVQNNGSVEVQPFKKTMDNDFVDGQIFSLSRSGHPIPSRLENESTVAGEFRKKFNERLEQLANEAGVKIHNPNNLHFTDYDREKFDKFKMREQGLKIENGVQTGALYELREKRVGGYVLKGPTGTLSYLPKESLRSDEHTPKLKTLVFIETGSNYTQRGLVLTNDKIQSLLRSTEENLIDRIARTETITENHPLKKTIEERTEFWKKRGVDLKAPDFEKGVAAFSKISDLNERVRALGSAKVIDELSVETGKQLRTQYASHAGIKINGQIIAIERTKFGANVIIETGSNYTLIRSTSNFKDVSVGEKVSVRSAEIVKENNQKRLIVWRFSDQLDKSKGILR